MSTAAILIPGKNGVERAINNAAAICADITDGKTLKEVCKVYGIRNEDLYKAYDTYPEFKKSVDVARVYNAYSLADELLTVTKDCVTIADAQIARIWSDNAKWVASKFVPNVFGDNINVNVNHTLDLSSILLAAENRVLPLLQASIVRHENASPSIIDKQDLATLDVDPQSTIIDALIVECAPKHDADTTDAIVTAENRTISIEDLF